MKNYVIQRLHSAEFKEWVTERTYKAVSRRQVVAMYFPGGVPGHYRVRLASQVAA